MSNLMRAELTRLRSRWRIWASALAIFIGCLAAPSVYMSSAMPITAEEVVAAEKWAKEAVASGCSECIPSDYLRSVTSLSELFTLSVMPLTFLVCLAAMAVVIFYTGSDFSSGAFSTQLTFTPQRSHLVLARCSSAAIYAMVTSALSLSAMAVATVLWYVAAHGVASFDVSIGVLGFVGWGALLSAFLGAIGAMLVFCFGSSTSSVAIVGGTLLTTLLPETTYGYSVATLQMTHINPTYQALSLIHNGWETYRSFPTDGDPIEFSATITRSESIVYFVVVTVVLLLLTLFVFRRRDLKA